ncbi:MAG: hypothetical protein FJX75_18760 [Armatimonadetes bacterium]|nr:hypothetical protein [Armatimonadota bacterium]
MATRLHVTAGRNVTLEEFTAALARQFGERWGDVKVSSAGGWHWFTVSVWGVAGGELDEALERLPGPSLRITTEDNSRWYLILRGKGQEPYVLCHEFSASRGGEDTELEEVDLLHFLRDDDSENLKTPPDPIEEVAESYADLGVALPSDLIERLKGLSYRRAVTALCQHFAEATADALQRFGVPHDREEVIGCLTGATVDAREWDHDIGDLPRFLVALGFGGEWRQTLDAQLAPPEYEACEPPPPPDPRSRIDALLTRAGEMQAVPVRGGPAVVPLDRAIHVADIAWYCGEWLGAAWTLDLPTGAAGGLGLESGADTYVVVEGDRVQIGEESVIPCHPNVDRSRLSVALQGLPAGAEIDLVTVGHEPMDEKAEAARMRFKGTVEGGAWRIDRAWPEAPGEAIEEAVELTVAVEGGQGLRARDEAEAEAIAEGAARHPMLDHRSTKREGLTFTRDSWAERYLALVVFRLRYSDIWNTKPYADEDEEMLGEWDELEKATTAPHAEEVLLEGQATRFYEADLGQLGKLDQEALVQAEAGMQALGLQPVGDVCCERAEAVLVRGYGAPGSLWWGVHMQAIDGQAYTEFVTRFADGACLTTTSNWSAESFPECGLFARVYGEADVARLHAKHLDGIDRVSVHRGTEPIAIEPTLLGLAQAMDDYLSSRGKGPGFVTCTLG